MGKIIRRIDTGWFLCEKQNERLSTFIQSTRNGEEDKRGTPQGHAREHCDTANKPRTPAGKDGGSI